MASSSPSNYTCENAPSRLLSLQDHIFTLHSVASEVDVTSTVPLDVADWLVLAAGLQEVSIITHGLAPGDDMCSNVYEADRGPAASAAATQLTRLLFLWGALEGLMRVKWGSASEVGRPRKLALFVDAADPGLRHHDCAARQLLTGLEQLNDAEFENVLKRAQRLEAGDLGTATFAAYQMRNSLAHGAMPWPDDDTVPSRPTVFLASASCRVLTFAAQCLLLEMIPPTAETIDPSDDTFTHVAIRDLLPDLHLDVATRM